MKIGFIEIYLIIINLITFIVFGVDKRAAIKKRSRIRVSTLLTLSFVGGSLGGLIAMYLFRHKTKKLQFTLLLPLMLILHIAAFLYSKGFIQF